MYLTNGMARAKLPTAVIERTLKTSGTRNWNSVTKLLEIAGEAGSFPMIRCALIGAG